MSADWYPGIRAFCAHWKHAPMLQETFAALEREFNEENDACIDAAKRFALRSSNQPTVPKLAPPIGNSRFNRS